MIFFFSDGSPTITPNSKSATEIDRSLLHVDVATKKIRRYITVILRETKLYFNKILPSDLQLNVTKHLIVACPDGFIGNNCQIPCRFPGYGYWCQSECQCSKNYCNHITGCNGKYVNTFLI